MDSIESTIYPDRTNTKFDIKYVPAKILYSDILANRENLIPSSERVQVNETETVVSTFNNIDGGFAASTYLALQSINGGNA